MLQVLIVDDEPNLRKTLSYCLDALGHKSCAVATAEDALTQARRQSFDLALVDLRLGADDGSQLIQALSAQSPQTKVVVITAHASVRGAVDLIRTGAIDIVEKPFSPDQIKLLTQRVARIRELENEVAVLAHSRGREGEALLASANPAMQRMLEVARRAAASDATLLIRGESGTGKSALARAIHHWSSRAKRPMAVVACPAVPSELLESELFGHVKGAFTGAVKDQPGKLSTCEGGTLLLDEIGDLPIALQAKLLRFIQDKEYERLGDPTPRRADVRILAATNVDLAKSAAAGRFREDLYYRLDVISLTVPPLRERREDIPALAELFLTHFRAQNRRHVLAFAPETAARLCEHDWPGNVRELRNAIERAVILGAGETLGLADLPDQLAARPPQTELGDLVSLTRIEELHIRGVLARTATMQEAAQVLGIDQATLWRKRKAMGL